MGEVRRKEIVIDGNWKSLYQQVNYYLKSLDYEEEYAPCEYDPFTGKATKHKWKQLD